MSGLNYSLPTILLEHLLISPSAEEREKISDQVIDAMTEDREQELKTKKEAASKKLDVNEEPENKENKVPAENGKDEIEGKAEDKGKTEDEDKVGDKGKVGEGASQETKESVPENKKG